MFGRDLRPVNLHVRPYTPCNFHRWCTTARNHRSHHRRGKTGSVSCSARFLNACADTEQPDCSARTRRTQFTRKLRSKLPKLCMHRRSSLGGAKITKIALTNVDFEILINLNAINHKLLQIQITCVGLWLQNYNQTIILICM